MQSATGSRAACNRDALAPACKICERWWLSCNCQLSRTDHGAGARCRTHIGLAARLGDVAANRLADGAMRVSRSKLRLNALQTLSRLALFQVGSSSGAHLVFVF